MIEKQDILSTEFLAMFNTLKEFVERNIPVAHIEESPQSAKMVDEIVAASSQTEERVEKPVEEIVENPAIKAIAADVAEILLQVKNIVYKDKIIDDLHQELMRYRNGLKESFNTPLLKAVVREYDRISKQYRIYLEKSRTEPQSELFNKLLSEFQMISFALLNLLSDNAIEPFDFNVGDAHEIKSQKIVEVIETEDREKDGTVAECVACGFRDIETAKLFRQAEVNIYKFNSKSIPIN